MSNRESYAGIAKCGCVHHAVVITGNDPMRVASAVAQMALDGLRVETHDNEQIRAERWACAVCDPQLTMPKLHTPTAPSAGGTE